MRGILGSFLILYIFCARAGVAAEISYELLFEFSTGTNGWHLEGRATVTGRAPAATDELVFRFFQGDNAPVTIWSVKEGDRDLPWDSVDPTAVVVFLSREEGQSFSVTFSYAIEVPPFPGGGYGTLAAGEGTVVVAQAYPVIVPWREGWVVEPVFDWGDASVADVANYVVEIELPPGWEAVATGVEEELASGAVYVRGDNLREFAFVLLAGHAVATTEASGTVVRSWFFPGHRHAGERALQLAGQALELYGELFGENPFPELDVVEVPLRKAAGVEFPGLLLAGEEYYRRYEEGRRELLFPMIFAHEVAHQWWYAQVGNDQVREPWVDEALATYTSGFTLATQGRFGELIEFWDRTYELAHMRNPEATPFDPLWKFPDGEGYGGIVYSGGALFFLDLEAAMGKEKLVSALRRYLAERRWEIATGADLVRILMEASGGEIEGVIETWRRGGRP